MRQLSPAWLAAALCLLASIAPAQAQPAPYRVAVFSRTAGFRHESIPVGIAAIQKLGVEAGFTVLATEDSGIFSDERLAEFDAVIWLSTTEDVLIDPEQAAFERYIEAGGGFVGIHAAADTEYRWPWYGGLVGAWFVGHGPVEPGDVYTVEHALTAGIASPWRHTDEWYSFATNPRDAGVRVLATLDESSVTPSPAMGDHPITWCSRYDGGRSWYTGAGHTSETFSDPEFLRSLRAGIEYAAGVREADCGAERAPTRPVIPYRRVMLVPDVVEPIALDIATDGRVFFIERAGALRVYDPRDGSTRALAQLPTSTLEENGLNGIALSPTFDDDGWIYLVYTSAEGTEQRVSRFLLGDTLDLTSEQVLLRIPCERGDHVAGALGFGADGTLYIATGDDTWPFDSLGYAPLDERPESKGLDSQRTAANSNDLRGKILRIRPRDDGTYSVPCGNMFAYSATTRPEIFTMGHRNPYRFTLHPQANWLLMSDYGPDALLADPTRGPRGQVELNIIKQPGFHGWPYCTGNNSPYVDYDFATGQSGASFNCAAPVNDSVNNTGLRALPPAVPATFWYANTATPEWPSLRTGGGPMAGPIYHYDAASTSARRFPRSLDGRWFVAEWTMSWLKTVRITDGAPTDADIEEFPYLRYGRPMDMRFGPDGALYMIDFGARYDAGTPPGIYRIEYTGSHDDSVVLPPPPALTPRATCSAPDTTPTGEVVVPQQPVPSISWWVRYLTAVFARLRG